MLALLLPRMRLSPRRPEADLEPEFSVKELLMRLQGKIIQKIQENPAKIPHWRLETRKGMSNMGKDNEG